MYFFAAVFLIFNFVIKIDVSIFFTGAPKIFEPGPPNFLRRLCVYQYVQAKFAYSGSVLSSSQFALLSQLSQNLTLITKIAINDSKIIILLLLFVKHAVLGGS
jgi:hypothetical protein